MKQEMKPRALRPVPPQLAAYVRPGRNDHTVLLQLLSEQIPRGMKGIVCDATLSSRHRELWPELRSHHLETVLDTRAMELAINARFEFLAPKLPWAGEKLHTPDVLKGEKGEILLASIVSFIAHSPISAVLAPTHFISSADDPWFDVDRTLLGRFRVLLDRAGMHEIPIYYPLGMPSAVFRNDVQRQRIVQGLLQVPADAIWLRISPFGSSTSGSLTLRACIEGSMELQRIGLPIVAERTGTIGLALLAFGVAGGIESGVGLGEHFDVNRWKRRQTSPSKFSPQPRVYIPEIGAFLQKPAAEKFFENNRRMKVDFGCRGFSCCRKGAADMIRDPRRHFLVRRFAEVARLSELPESLRPQMYMEEVLRPATDRIVRAARAEPSLGSAQKRLEKWRYTLGSILAKKTPLSFAKVPEGSRLEVRIGA